MVCQLVQRDPQEFVESELYNILPALVTRKDLVSLRKISDLLEQDERNVYHILLIRF
jgi:hypothetical protein